MKKLSCIFLLGLLFISCSTKTTDLIIESNPNVVLEKMNEIKITRIQKGNSQTNDSNEEYLNYYLFLVKNGKDIPLKIVEDKTNNNCEQNRINIQNGSKLSNIFNRDILFKKEENSIFVYVDCVLSVYQFPYENKQNLSIKLIIEDKKFTQVKDSVIFNLKTL